MNTSPFPGSKGKSSSQTHYAAFTEQAEHEETERKGIQETKSPAVPGVALDLEHISFLQNRGPVSSEKKPGLQSQKTLPSLFT